MNEETKVGAERAERAERAPLHVEAHHQMKIMVEKRCKEDEERRRGGGGGGVLVWCEIMR